MNKKRSPGTISLEQVLFLGAAVLLAMAALPSFFAQAGEYFSGFSEVEVTDEIEVR